MKKIGFIGLGIMGKPMAKNLLRNGFELNVFDINEEAVNEVVLAGGKKCASISEIGKECNVIFTMLPNSPHCKSVMIEDGGLIDYAKEGTLIIDMSSISPTSSQEISKVLKQKGIRLIDAPVSGGEPKAIEGTLAIMVGGSDEDFNEAKPYFEVLGATYVLVGDVGAGNTTKLANQIIVAINIAAVSEAFMLAKCANVDPQKVLSAISQGLAGSTVMSAKVPMMLDRNFKPGFKIDLHIKDLNNAIEAGQVYGAPLFLTSEVMQMLQTLKLDGEGQSDHSALVKFYEKLSNIELA